MSADVRFFIWFAVYWLVLLAWRIYRHWRGDRHTREEWFSVNITEWCVFFAIWLLVLR